MKTMYCLLVLALIYAAPLYSQKPIESQAIPELQEWWRAPANEKGLGQYGVSYIPNFYHGKDAMGVSIKSGQMETWLNRFPGDRENIFTWKGGGPVLQGDFNGDGITDYLGGAIVYRGVKNGEPPDSIPVRTLTISPDLIADVNHDGFDDIVEWFEEGGTGAGAGGLVGRIAYGAAEFKDMKVISAPCASSMDSTMELERMFMGSDGDMRVLMFSFKHPTDPRTHFNGYVLFRAKWKTGDTIPMIEKLSEVIRHEGKDIEFQRGGAIYQSKYHSNIYFIAMEFLGMTNHNVIYYDLSNDTFEQKLKYNMTNMYFYPMMLNRSIDGDKYEDWYVNPKSGEALIFSGGITLDSVPRFKVTNKELGLGLTAIGDVTLDSIADIAVVGNYFDEQCFFIVKSLQRPTGISSESIFRDTCSMDVLTPHPINIHANNKLSVTVNQEKQYRIILYNSLGQYISFLYDGIINKGKYQISLVFPSKEISQGEYILRLVSGENVVAEKRVIIIH